MGAPRARCPTAGSARVIPHAHASPRRALSPCHATRRARPARPHFAPPQVAGDRGAGVATVEAVNHQGRVVVTLLALDAPGGGGPAGDGLLLVTGTEEKLHVTGTLRAFLTTERARFIPQDRTLTEEELLREQAALPADAADEDDGDNAATPPPGKPT